MEIKIKNGVIVSDAFFPAFHKLLQRQMPAKLCLELNAAFDEINTQMGVVARTRRAIVMQYCLKDEKEQPKGDDAGMVVFENDELKDKCYSEINEILQEPIVLTLTQKVPIYDDDVITPDELRILGDLIEIVERPK